MSLKMKLNIVNKHEYEENEDYREIIIKIPKGIEKLEKDFNYLGLDYNNLSIQDTHVLECEVIDTDDPHFSAIITTKILNIMERANNSGYTTPYQDIKSMFATVKVLGNFDRDKLLAVLETKKEQINNINDLITCAKQISNYNLLPNITNYYDMGKYLVEETGHFDEVSLLDGYIDYYKLAKDYTQKGYTYQGEFTEYGYLMEKEFEEEIKNEDVEFGEEEVM